MRVLVNMLVASGKKTGIGHYISQTLRCLRDLAAEDSFEEFPRPWLRWCWSKCNQLRPYLERKNKGQSLQKEAPSAKSGLRGRLLGSLRGAGQALITGHLRGICRRTKYDLYHEPNYIPFPSDLPTVATVHDLSILLHPEWHPADRVRHFERHFERALRQCVHFLAISEFGRQEIIQTFNLPPERITRTYMGVRPGLCPLPRDEVEPVLKRLGLPPQYLLYLGTIEPRKNLLMLMKAYCSLPASLRELWPLVLVGGWGWNTGAIRAYLDSEARSRGVIHLGYVPDEFVNVLFNGARALLYPSHYEGFGLPPIEMMACGGAVLASTAGAVVETVGTRADLIPADDVEGWSAAMHRVVEDDDWCGELRRGTTEIARPFTWQQCAVDTLRVYQQICSGEKVKSILPLRFRTAG